MMDMGTMLFLCFFFPPLGNRSPVFRTRLLPLPSRAGILDRVVRSRQGGKIVICKPSKTSGKDHSIKFCGVLPIQAQRPCPLVVFTQYLRARHERSPVTLDPCRRVSEGVERPNVSGMNEWRDPRIGVPPPLVMP